MSDVVTEKKKERQVVFSYFFLSGLISASWSSRIPDVQKSLGLNDASFGIILSSLYAGLFTGLAIASWLVASYGTKKILVITCFLSALLLVMTASTTLALVLSMVLFAIGFARTIFNLAANTAALEVQRHYQRPIISGFHGVWSLACFIAGGIGTLMIISRVEPLFHFLVIAGVVVVSLFFLKEKAGAATAPRERKPFFVMPDKYLFLLGLMALCSMLCEGAMFDWSVSYFENMVGAKTSVVTAGYLSFIIAMALVRLAGDRLIAAFGIFRILLVNGTLMVIGFITIASLPYVVPAAIGFMLIGTGASILVPVIYMLASKSRKMPPAYALSSVTIIGYTGFLAGPLLIGNLSEHFGMNIAFYGLAIVSAGIVVLSIIIKKLVPVTPT